MWILSLSFLFCQTSQSGRVCKPTICASPILDIRNLLLLLSWSLLQDKTWFSHLVCSFSATCKHTHKSFMVSQRGAVAVRKDLQGPPVLPAVGWLEGLAVFVKVMGSRWANSQGTRSMLCHLRSTLVEKEVADGGWGLEGGKVSSSRALPKIPSALLCLLQLHLKVITRPAVSKQAPYGVSIVGLRLEPGEPSSTSLERRGLSKHS